MTLAELLALPLMVDVSTAARALGLSLDPPANSCGLSLILLHVYVRGIGRGRLAADWFCGLSYVPDASGAGVYGRLAVRVR